MNICKTCRKPKANYDCGLCQEHICKSCAQFLGEDHFTFLKKIPQDLTHTTYCVNCFDEKVRDAKEEYDATMDKAREVIIFTKAQTKITSRVVRKADPYKVENCEDEQEAIMRMSFFAVQEDYNALVDIIVNTKKIVIGSHKKTVYSATAIPVTLDPKSIRDDWHD